MNGEPRNPDQPAHDRLHDYEIDLTGVVEQTESLITVIGDAIIEAGDDNEVPDWGARVMARFLANRLVEPNSALHHFAVTGHAAYDRIGNELADLWMASRDDFTSEVINRLGTYLVNERQQVQIKRQVNYSEHVRERIHELGPAFAAFLTLPDVDPVSAEESFHQCYYGSCSSLLDIIAMVADGLEIWARIDEAMLTDLVSPDPRQLLLLAVERWDIVALGGTYYLFEK